MTTTAAPAPALYRSYIEPNADAEFPAEAGRYHLYVTYSCPFACRALAARNLKGLQDVVSVSVAAPIYQKTRPNDPEDSHHGWTFVDPATTPTVTAVKTGKVYSTDGCVPDTVNHASFVRDLYELVDKTPRAFTVPVLWDKKKQTIVSNESADILRTLNSGFRELVPSDVDLVPSRLEQELSAANGGIVAEVSSSLFKSIYGDAESKKAAVELQRSALERLNEILATKRFLLGDAITEADVRMFHTLIRIDAFATKETQGVLTQHENIVGYLRDLYQTPALKDSVKWDHLTVAVVNKFPDAAEAEGPTVDYGGPHSRDRL